MVLRKIRERRKRLDELERKIEGLAVDIKQLKCDHPIEYRKFEFRGFNGWCEVCGYCDAIISDVGLVGMNKRKAEIYKQLYEKYKGDK